MPRWIFLWNLAFAILVVAATVSFVLGATDQSFWWLVPISGMVSINNVIMLWFAARASMEISLKKFSSSEIPEEIKKKVTIHAREEVNQTFIAHISGIISVFFTSFLWMAIAYACGSLANIVFQAIF